MIWDATVHQHWCSVPEHQPSDAYPNEYRKNMKKNMGGRPTLNLILRVKAHPQTQDNWGYITGASPRCTGTTRNDWGNRENEAMHLFVKINIGALPL